MSVPHFKEICVIEIEQQIREYTEYLTEQQQADYAQLRAYQGIIKGLKLSRAIINEKFKDAY